MMSILSECPCSSCLQFFFLTILPSATFFRETSELEPKLFIAEVLELLRAVVIFYGESVAENKAHKHGNAENVHRNAWRIDVPLI